MIKTSHLVFVLVLLFAAIFSSLGGLSRESAEIKADSVSVSLAEPNPTTELEQNTQKETEVLSVNNEVPGSDPNFLTNIVPVKPTPAPAPVPESKTPPPPPAPKPAPRPTQAPAPAPAAAPTTTTAQACSSGSFHSQFQCLINQYRKSKGLNALNYEAKLNNTAVAHSTWMSQNNILSHEGKEGSRFYERCAAAGTTCDAENVARGYSSAKALFDAWKKSPGHDANMLRSHSVMGLALIDNYSTLVFR